MKPDAIKLTTNLMAKNAQRFNANTVKQIPITEYLESRGVTVKGKRCAATWRGGNGLNVSIDTEKNLWYDFKMNEGGSIIDLCMKIEGLSFYEAIHALGHRYGISPDAGDTPQPRKPRSKDQPNWVKVATAAKTQNENGLSVTERRLAQRVQKLSEGKTDGDVLNVATQKVIEEYHTKQPTPTGCEIDFAAMVMRGHDLHTMPTPEHKWIIRDLIEHGDKGQIVGSPKIRKSYCAKNLALAISNGHPFMGFEVCERVPVLYVDLELKRDNLILREHLISADLGIREGDGVDWLSLRGLGRQVRESEESLISFINSNGYGVVILDCAYKLYLKDENENDAVSMSQYLDWKSRICEATNAAVIDILHDAKGFGGDRQGNDRGSGSNVHARDYDFRMVLTPDAITANGIVFDFYGREIANVTDRLGIFEGDNCAALVYHPEIKARKLTSATANAIGKADANEANMIAVLNRDSEKVMNEITLNGTRSKSALQTQMHSKGIGRDRFKAALASLLNDGTIVCERFKGLGRTSYDMIGTPNQIESLRREVEMKKCHVEYLAGHSQAELDGV